MSLKITTLIFDWGNTIMLDHQHPGKMQDWEKVDWVPGAEEALALLSPYYNMVIATSANHSDTGDMLGALKRVGAEQYFQHFFSSKDLGVAKPDPAFFSEILSQLGQDAASAISIGDRYPNDIEAAAKAGLKTVWYCPDGREGDFPAADAMITSMTKLVNTITSFNTLR